MKFKKTAITLLSFVCIANSFCQDKISAIINNKIVGEQVITESPTIISVSKAKFKNVSRLVLKYTLQNPTSPIRRTIEITNDAELPFFMIKESYGGMYYINFARSKKRLNDQKIIKVFLMESPANRMMGMPSRRRLITELHLK